jgi:hypothetical protein
MWGTILALGAQLYFGYKANERGEEVSNAQLQLIREQMANEATRADLQEAQLDAVIKSSNEANKLLELLKDDSINPDRIMEQLELTFGFNQMKMAEAENERAAQERARAAGPLAYVPNKTRDGKVRTLDKARTEEEKSRATDFTFYRDQVTVSRSINDAIADLDQPSINVDRVEFYNNYLDDQRHGRYVDPATITKLPIRSSTT